MTNEEMRKAMEFIVKMDSQTVIKLDRLGKKVRAIKVTQGRFEKRWKETEKRIRALLAQGQNHGTKNSCSKAKHPGVRQSCNGQAPRDCDG